MRHECEILDRPFDQMTVRAKLGGVSHRTAAMAIGVERVRRVKRTKAFFLDPGYRCSSGGYCKPVGAFMTLSTLSQVKWPLPSESNETKPAARLTFQDGAARTGERKRNKYCAINVEIPPSRQSLQ